MWWALRYHGHDNVRLLDGGFGRWAAEKRPTEAGVLQAESAECIAHVHQQTRVTADEVQVALDDANTFIADALPEMIYSGEMNLYPTHRAGHIPGALDIPAPDNLDPAAMTLLPADDPIRLWERAGLSPELRVITYCGGGVYASFALFALRLLGHENAALCYYRMVPGLQKALKHLPEVTDALWTLSMHLPPRVVAPSAARPAMRPNVPVVGSLRVDVASLRHHMVLKCQNGDGIRFLPRSPCHPPFRLVNPLGPPLQEILRGPPKPDGCRSSARRRCRPMRTKDLHGSHRHWLMRSTHRLW